MILTKLAVAYWTPNGYGKGGSKPRETKSEMDDQLIPIGCEFAWVLRRPASFLNLKPKNPDFCKKFNLYRFSIENSSKNLKNLKTKKFRWKTEKKYRLFRKSKGDILRNSFRQELDCVLLRLEALGEWGTRASLSWQNFGPNSIYTVFLLENQVNFTCTIENQWKLSFGCWVARTEAVAGQERLFDLLFALLLLFKAKSREIL